LSSAFEEIGGFLLWCVRLCDLLQANMKQKMEKETRTRNEATWKDTAEEAASGILLHSRDRMLKVEGPYQPEHKAYMVLALDEGIR
jgi:hypothetical protein